MIVVNRSLNLVAVCFLLSVFFTLGAGVSHAAELARIDDVVIEDSNLLDEIQLIPTYQRKGLEKDRLLNKTIDEILLAREAKKLKLDETPEYKKFLELLIRAQLSEAYLKKVYSEKNREEDQRKFLEENSKKFMAKERVRISVITLQKPEAESTEIYKNLMDRIKNGDSFGAIAKEVSVNQYNVLGGEIPEWRTRRDMVAEFGQDTSDLVFSMKKDEIKGPIKDRGGFHIVKLLEYKPEHVLDFEKVRRVISAEIMNTLLEEETKKLRAASQITINKKVLDEIVVP